MIAPELGANTLALLESPPLAQSLSLPQSSAGEEGSPSEPSVGKASEPDRTEVALTALINEIAAAQPARTIATRRSSAPHPGAG